MKHLYIALLASAALTTACSDYNDQFEGLKEGHHAVDVKKINYTLTAADYKTIAEDATNKALAKQNGEEKELAALAKNMQFTEKITAKEYLPAFLAKKWFTADNGSAVIVNYKRHETTGALDLYQDFEGTENKAVQPAAVKDWQTLTTLGGDKAAWSTQFRNNAHYLQASAYKQKDSVQTYLVSPVFTVSKGSKLTFDALYGHYVEKGGRLSVFLYDGASLTQETVASRQPLADLSKQVKIEVPAAGQSFGTFKQAINADLSKYAGQQVQLALRYDGNGKTGATTTVQLDSLVVGDQKVNMEPGKDQFVLNNHKWVFDPSTVVTLGARGDKPTQAFYQSIVNWVKEKKGAEYIDARGNAESYSGISSHYNNVDFSATTVRKNTPAAFKDVKDADIPALLQKNLYETLAAGLSLNYADAVPVQGVDVIYTVKFMVYDGATKNYEVKFKVTGKGKFEPIAKSLKEVK